MLYVKSKCAACVRNFEWLTSIKSKRPNAWTFIEQRSSNKSETNNEKLRFTWRPRTTTSGIENIWHSIVTHMFCKQQRRLVLKCVECQWNNRVHGAQIRYSKIERNALCHSGHHVWKHELCNLGHEISFHCAPNYKSFDDILTHSLTHTYSLVSSFACSPRPSIHMWNLPCCIAVFLFSHFWRHSSSHRPLQIQFS